MIDGDVMSALKNSFDGLLMPNIDKNKDVFVNQIIITYVINYTPSTVNEIWEIYDFFKNNPYVTSECYVDKLNNNNDASSQFYSGYIKSNNYFSASFEIIFYGIADVKKFKFFNNRANKPNIFNSLDKGIITNVRVR